MEAKRIKVEDTFKISDKNTAPVKGVVVLKDENGKIIFKKNNLVVYKGRDLIMNLFLDYLTKGDSKNTVNNITGSKNKVKNSEILVRIGSNNGITQSDTDITSTGLDSATNGEYKPTINILTEDLGIKFSISITGSGLSAINMSELGLVLKETIDEDDDGTNPETENIFLFSRIVFDPLPFTSNNTYLLDYYLYF